MAEGRVIRPSHICVVDGRGKVLARGREATQPELLAKAIQALAPATRSSGDTKLFSPTFPQRHATAITRLAPVALVTSHHVAQRGNTRQTRTSVNS